MKATTRKKRKQQRRRERRQAMANTLALFGWEPLAGMTPNLKAYALFDGTKLIGTQRSIAGQAMWVNNTPTAAETARVMYRRIAWKNMPVGAFYALRDRAQMEMGVRL